LCYISKILKIESNSTPVPQFQEFPYFISFKNGFKILNLIPFMFNVRKAKEDFRAAALDYRQYVTWHNEYQ